MYELLLAAAAGPPPDPPPPPAATLTPTPLAAAGTGGGIADADAGAGDLRLPGPGPCSRPPLPPLEDELLLELPPRPLPLPRPLEAVELIGGGGLITTAFFPLGFSLGFSLTSFCFASVALGTVPMFGARFRFSPLPATSCGSRSMQADWHFFSSSWWSIRITVIGTGSTIMVTPAEGMEELEDDTEEDELITDSVTVAVAGGVMSSTSGCNFSSAFNCNPRLLRRPLLRGDLCSSRLRAIARWMSLVS